MKNKLILFSLLISLITYSQKNISIQSVQDIRLATIGDNRGNNPFTPNVLTTFKMNGLQNEFGYVVVGISYEFASLKDDMYKRFSVSAGYIWNKLIVDDFEVGIFLNYGGISRWEVAFLSFGIINEINYKLNDNFKLVLLNQLSQRSDLKYRYNTDEFKFSVFLGIEINLKSL